ncbi:MAG: ABC transporter permease [Gemmatimonadota bacterium]
MSVTSIWRHVTRGVRALVPGSGHDRDLQDELTHYLDQATKAHIANGLTLEDARRAAQRDVGNLTVARESVHASLWENTIATLVTDVRYAMRMLRRSPVFTTIIVLVISLGIGAVTTIFSAANGILFKPLPGASDPGRLVGIDRIEPAERGGTQATYPYYRFLRERTRTLSGIAAWGKATLTLNTGQSGHSVYANIVSGNFFSVLGVRPALGRFFLPEEDVTPLTHPVIVVSHEFWESALGADSSAIGRTIGVNGAAFTLVGVAPRGFRGVFTPIVTSAWVPLMMAERVRPRTDFESAAASWLWTFGRLNRGVNREVARQELRALTADRIAQGVEPKWMERNNGIRLIGLTGLPDDAHKAMLAFASVLLGVAIMVLLIASVNVAAMLSARAVARQHEMAIRVALGAGRLRLVRQLLTESVMLFVLGAAGGVGLACGATWLLERIPLPIGEPLSLELSPDYRVLVFALLVSLVTGVLFGLAPALRAARLDVTSRLRNDSRTGDARRGLISNALVVGQLALSLLLLVSAGLLLRALDHGRSVDPRFDVKGVATAELKAESWGYDEAKARTFYRALRERVQGLPGVTEVSYTSRLPLQMSSSSSNIRLDNAQTPGRAEERGTPVQTDVVDVDYFSVVRIPVLAGRPFRTSDDQDAPRVAIVNETFAKKHWAVGGAIGQTFVADGTQVTIIGIARDAKYSTLTETTPSHVYYAVGQGAQTELTLMVRTTGSADSLRAPIRDAVLALDRGLPPPAVVSLENATSFVLLPQRVAAMVTGALGVLGLLLASIGLYGIISYSVSRRSREIGVRMALGARATDVHRMVVRSGMRLTAMGVVIGLVLAMAASRLLVAFLYGVNPLDALTFAATSALLVAVAFLASYLPARRAAAADPLVALRSN